MKQHIILDTNIVDSQLKGDWKSQTHHLLSELEKDDFGTAISAITQYEILRTAKASVLEEARKTLELLYTYEVTRDVLLFAAELYGYYKDQNVYQKGSPSDADVIIAATAVITNSLLLTRDFSDFPPPFFKEVARWRADKRKGREQKSLFLYLFKVDTSAINAGKKGQLDKPLL